MGGRNQAGRERLGTVGPRDWLTERELEVLRLAAEGCMVTETAERMFLGHETVKTYRARIFLMLGARNLAHAVALAYERGILPVPCAPASAASQVRR